LSCWFFCSGAAAFTGGVDAGNRRILFRSIRSSTSHAATASEIKRNLLVDHLTGVDVDVSEGVVMLVGHLPTAADRQKAYDDAAKVTGVKTVVNHIDVP
jgi:osmotically-inducible protein OsmY